MLKKIDYLPFLEACWQEHLAPRAPNAPMVISLFTGCGGSSLGYSMAGFRELLAVDWDKNAAATFRLNFPDVTFWQGDIVQLSDDEALRLAGVKSGQLDVLDGSPPCQGFSTAGKRQLNDSRNSLFHEYVRLLRAFNPRAFVMENVSGLVKGKMKLIFAEIMKELKASGYRVSCRLLNAMWFNVPQSRERLIWIGVREDLEIKPSHPGAENKPIVVREAFNKLPLQSVPKYLASGQVAKIIHEMRQGEDGSKASLRLNGNENKWFNLRRLNWNMPGFTITKAEGSSILIHPETDRVISITEMQRIMSFPDATQFTGKFKEIKACIGNSVPPLFMRAIALHIRNLLTGIEPRLVET